MALDRAHGVAQTATNLSYTASGGTLVIGGLTANEMAALVGAVLAIATFVINWVYRHKTYKLQLREFEEGKAGKK